MNQKILVAVDNSAATAKILEYVAGLASRLDDIQLLLVTIAVGISEDSQELAALNGSAPAPELHGDEDHMQQLLVRQQLLNKSLDKLQASGVPAERIATALLPDQGGVAIDLLEAARQFECKTLVVGRRHGAGLRHFLLGSTSEKLVEDAVDLTLWVVA